MKFPIITLHMPWAYWVFHGWKQIETRTHQRFACLSGKTIGIHASQKWDNYALEAAEDYLSDWQLQYTREALEKCDYYHGCILCTVECIGFRKLNAADSPIALIDCERTERWGNILKNQAKVDPFIKARGFQGIWHYDLPTSAPGASPKGLQTS